MLFKDFKYTMEYLTADVIEFVDINGAELENILPETVKSVLLNW